MDLTNSAEIVLVAHATDSAHPAFKELYVDPANSDPETLEPISGCESRGTESNQFMCGSVQTRIFRRAKVVVRMALSDS